ncbi:MAG: DNA cytosine methyltransferase [Bacteroidales bacterium]|nr:DNA cytosine methyltransferase [Candidatus Scybalousia scybalohippi]
METNILGNIEESNKHQSGNVYDSNGTSPNIMAGTHGYGMGYVLDDKKICAMRGRDKDNPSDRTVGNQNLEQRLEVNENGTSNTITSVQKDNLVLETKDVNCVGFIEHGTGKHQSNSVYDTDGLSPNITTIQGGGTQQIKILDAKKIKIRQATKDGFVECELPGIADLNYTSSKTRRGRVVEGGQISPTLTTENIPSLIELGDSDFYNFLYDIDGEIYLIRIRKLTPRECGRLQDVSDIDITKMEQAESNTQLYKAFGNSITVNVLTAIFGQLFDGKEDVYKQVNDDFSKYMAKPE